MSLKVKLEVSPKQFLGAWSQLMMPFGDVAELFGGLARRCSPPLMGFGRRLPSSSSHLTFPLSDPADVNKSQALITID